MSETNVAAGQAKMSEDVNTRLQLQSQQMDVMGESVSKVQEETANNTEILQTLLVDMENLGDNFRQLREEMLMGGSPEVQMEMEEEREYQDTDAELL